MKKSITLLVAIALVAGGGFGVYNLLKGEEYANLQVVTERAAFKHHSSVEELESEAELVVIDTFTGKREPFKVIDGQGLYVSTLSKSTVQIEKVLKGDA
jgi:hypothetical protein